MNVELNIDTSHNRVIVLTLFSSLGGIFHTSLPGESAERVVKSRKHPELTLPELIMLLGTNEIFSICSLPIALRGPALQVVVI